MTDSRATTQHESNTDCHSFQASLPELFETDAGLHEQPHLATCAACTALVRDLEYIAAQAKLLLPMHDPSPAVWENIQSALVKPGSRSKRSL
ncbi:MAG TPA: hypothetical protein VMU62_02760 [Acidobacteriaceae bacterium]|nr:hypothetical protein [Acidobacteriaceae bacterium]